MCSDHWLSMDTSIIASKMDYSQPEKRKSKADKKAKARYSRYKKGGGRRTGGRTDEKKGK